MSLTTDHLTEERRLAAPDPHDGGGFGVGGADGEGGQGGEQQAAGRRASAAKP